MFIKTRRNTAATNEQVEESGYMASASDLMIGLLFIFIVMVMVLQRAEKYYRSPQPVCDRSTSPEQRSMAQQNLVMSL